MKHYLLMFLIVATLAFAACSQKTQDEAAEAAVNEGEIKTGLEVAGRWNTSTGGWIEFGEDDDFTTDTGELGVYRLVEGEPMRIQLQSDFRDVEYPIDLLSETEMHWMHNGVILVTLTKAEKE